MADRHAGRRSRGCALGGALGGALGAMLFVGLIILGGLTWAWFHRTPMVISPTCKAVAGPYSGQLDPDQARNAALIAGMAVRRGLPPRAATIALATAAQESKLRNVSYGDRDSVGLFQQRPSQGWGTRAQIMDPIYSSGKFYEHLVKVHGYRTMPITVAAQRVQRSGFPAAYARHEEESRALAASFYGQYPAALSCQLAPPKAKADAARGIVDAADRDLGLRPKSQERTKLVYTFADKQRAWGLAHWATASADEFGITAVHTDGRVWKRRDAEFTWGNDATAARTVVIEIAA